MIIDFTVKDLPPKKDGSQSMWGKPIEVERLIALRKAAFQALEEHQPLNSNIKLTLNIHIGPVNNRSIGDLDTFIAGVCDGLMAAASNSKLDPIWIRPELQHIHPKETIAIVDDSHVIDIHAKKIIGNTEPPWYQVILEANKIKATGQYDGV